MTSFILGVANKWVFYQPVFWSITIANLFHCFIFCFYSRVYNLVYKYQQKHSYHKFIPSKSKVEKSMYMFLRAYKSNSRCLWQRAEKTMLWSNILKVTHFLFSLRNKLSKRQLFKIRYSGLFTFINFPINNLVFHLPADAEQFHYFLTKLSLETNYFAYLSMIKSGLKYWV